MTTDTLAPPQAVAAMAAPPATLVAAPAGARPNSRCLDLRFEVDGHGRSFIASQYVRYPMHICRPHRHAALPDAAMVTLQSVSGGLFEGERLQLRVHTGAGAQAWIATSASTIVHSMRGDWAEQQVSLVAQERSRLLYLPEPVILFPQARLLSGVTVQAAADASVICCDSLLAHDPGNTAASFAWFDARLRVVDAAGQWRAGERLLVDGPGWSAQRNAITGRYAVHASLWVIDAAADAQLLRRLRAALDAQGDAVYGGASTLPQGTGLQLRLLCTDAVALRRALAHLQDALTDHLRRVVQAAPDSLPLQPEGLLP